MRLRRVPTHLRRNVVAYLALFFALGGVGHAALVSSDGAIRACVSDQVGANTRIVDEADACEKNEVAVTWSQTGPTGPAGPAGQSGPAGQAGPAGTAATQGPVGLNTQQLGKPAAGLATKPGKVKRRVVRATVNTGLKKKKAVVVRRTFVTGRSGPLETPTVQYSLTTTSSTGETSTTVLPPFPDPYARAKTARIACPASAPKLVSLVGEGVEGDWDPAWEMNSGQYDEGGVSKAFMSVTTRFSGPRDGSLELRFPGDLGSYVFEITGECVR